MRWHRGLIMLRAMNTRLQACPPSLCNPLLLALLLLLAEPTLSQDGDPDSGSPVQISNQQQEQIALYRQQLAEMEGELGPYDGALVEVLSSLADALIDAGDFDEAQLLLNRRLQLLRTLAGPENPAQLPVLEEMIANNIRRGEWQDVTRHFEFTSWIMEQDEEADLENRLTARNDVAQWLLMSVSLDDPRNRIRNFMDALEIQGRIVFDMEDQVGKDSTALIPWLYRHALNQYRTYAFLQAEDELGYDAYQEMQRGYLADDDYQRRGLNIVKRIRDIVEQGDDLEAQAMALIYDADFQALADLGTATSRYRQAIGKLLEAGIAQSQVDAFFATPMVLPVDRYFTRLSDMQDWAAQFAVPDEAFGELEEGTLNLGRFDSWNESLPFARMPGAPAAAGDLAIDLRQVDLRFRIDSRGKISAPKVIAADPDETRVRRDAMDAVRKMQLRPRILDGRGRRAGVAVLRYRYPAPL